MTAARSCWARRWAYSAYLCSAWSCSGCHWGSIISFDWAAAALGLKAAGESIRPQQTPSRADLGPGAGAHTHSRDVPPPTGRRPRHQQSWQTSSEVQPIRSDGLVGGYLRTKLIVVICTAESARAAGIVWPKGRLRPPMWL